MLHPLSMVSAVLLVCDRCRAGESDLVDAHMLRSCGSHRKSSLLNQLTNLECGECGRCGCGFDE